MNTQESNKLIAQFDGKIKDEDTAWYRGFDFIIHGKRSCHEEQMEYHLSWDWLMPVVEKIHNEISLPKNETHLYIFLNLTIFSSIEQVYEAVIQFIQYYNQQK